MKIYSMKKEIKIDAIAEGERKQENKTQAEKKEISNKKSSNKFPKFNWIDKKRKRNKQIKVKNVQMLTHITNEQKERK